jgi:hypothetical protein
MNKKISKKAQLQSGETVVVVIIVTIMIIIGVVVATKNKANSITQESEDLNDLKAMNVAILASHFNELKCSDYSVMVNSCIDMYRAQAFADIVSTNKQNSKEYYYSSLGNSKIVLTIYMPISTPEKYEQQTITLYDYDNSANKSSSPVFMPVIVLDAQNKVSYFSILEVRTYS